VENQATDRPTSMARPTGVWCNKFKCNQRLVEEKIDRMIREKPACEDITAAPRWLGGLDPGQLRDLVALND